MDLFICGFVKAERGAKFIEDGGDTVVSFVTFNQGHIVFIQLHVLCVIVQEQKLAYETVYSQSYIDNIIETG